MLPPQERTMLKPDIAAERNYPLSSGHHIITFSKVPCSPLHESAICALGRLTLRIIVDPGPGVCHSAT
jgi:hypothetical protein